MKTKDVAITFFLSQDMADRLPQDNAERQEYLVNAVKNSFSPQAYASSFARMGGKVKSERKAVSSRENGKKGGRPRKKNTPES
jgi:hypothetical protein